MGIFAGGHGQRWKCNTLYLETATTSAPSNLFINYHCDDTISIWDWKRIPGGGRADLVLS